MSVVCFHKKCVSAASRRSVKCECYLKLGDKCLAKAGREWNITSKWPLLWVRVKSNVIKISICCSTIGGSIFRSVFLNRRLIRFVVMYLW